MPNPTSILASVAPLAQVITGSEAELQLTRLQALRVAQLEPPGFEIARAGRSFAGGIMAVANGIVPVVDLPTVLGPIVLFNAYPSGGKLLCVKRIGLSTASSTVQTATGFLLFGGVTPSVLATPLTANGTGVRTQAKRGFGTPGAFIDVAKTIPTGTAWQTFDGKAPIPSGGAVTGPGTTADCSNDPFVVPPLFAFTWGALGDTGTTTKYIFTVEWDEIEADLI